MNKGFSLTKYTVKALPRSLITILIIMANRENKINKEQRTDCEYRIMLTSNDCLNKEIEKKGLYYVNVSVNSCCTHLLGYCGAFARLVNPGHGGGVSGNFA